LNEYDVANVALEKISEGYDGSHVHGAMALMDFAVMVLTAHGHDRGELISLFDDMVLNHLELQGELEREELLSERMKATIQ
jgi:hypothetical protein